MITPVRGFTTKWSVSCIPYFTGDPSGSWPLRTNTSVPTFVDSESVRPAGYPFGSRIGGSFTLFAPGTTTHLLSCWIRSVLSIPRNFPYFRCKFLIKNFSIDFLKAYKVQDMRYGGKFCRNFLKKKCQILLILSSKYLFHEFILLTYFRCKFVIKNTV